MSDNLHDDLLSDPVGDNQPPLLSVAELSGDIKRTVEDKFAYVRVRGEISGFKRAASGHLYMALKDADAVIDGVCWKGTAGRLDIQPEDGLEVIATGRVTTYAARSKYQLVIERFEVAGEGALLKMIEERRKRLALVTERARGRLQLLVKKAGNYRKHVNFGCEQFGCSRCPPNSIYSVR